MQSTATDFQNRCARWLLLLTFIHTVPALWITPVSGGTVPVVAFFAFAVATLPQVTLEGVAFTLMALVPGLVYLAIAWLFAWLLARWLLRLSKVVGILLLAAIVIPLLLIVYQPIYVSGGHSGSSSYDLWGLIDDFRLGASIPVLRVYWIALHGLLALLFASQFATAEHSFFASAERLRKPAMVALAVLMLIAIGYRGHPLLICRPLAGLGVASAQVCVARVGGNQAPHWYERAAFQGNLEAINWMVRHSVDGNRALWVRRGAEAGDGALQYQLYRSLARSGEPTNAAQANDWLKRAAQNGFQPAQTKVAAQLYAAANESQSKEQLAAYQVQLERAAQQGSRDAKVQLAQHYSNGSMGYPADLAQARAFYVDLADNGEPSENESRLGYDEAFYAARIVEVDNWALGLKNYDPAIMKTMAKRYLRSPLPGEGVQARGMHLLQLLADSGDKAAQEALLLGLRTGSGGIAKDLDAAMRMQLSAANAGDLDAMERVRAGYFSGQQGYPLDYVESRRWINALLKSYQSRIDKASQARVQQLKRDLAYIDRIEKRAGGTLLAGPQLDQLGGKTDAVSHYQFALQLLAGQGSSRRAEAIERLNQAASLGHGEAAWRLVHIYERGFPNELNRSAALRMLRLAVENHQFDASKELAFRYEDGKKGVGKDLPKAVALYEATLSAAKDNRYGWDLDRDNYNHFAWVESRLRQARAKLEVQTASSGN
ncbi:MAG: tetratricopeptide repeat protein [Pseudomonadales bacterium]